MAEFRRKEAIWQIFGTFLARVWYSVIVEQAKLTERDERMRQGEDILFRELVREQAHCNEQAEGALVEEWLDVVIRVALELAVGNAERAAAVWTEIRESIEARLQTSLTRDGE